MPDKALPPNVKIDGVEFHLVEDYTVEETRFKSGIPEPFAAFKDVLEPVLVKREGFPIALEVSRKDDLVHKSGL